MAAKKWILLMDLVEMKGKAVKDEQNPGYL